MSENISYDGLEKAPERFPTQEQVIAILTTLGQIEEGNYTVTQSESDENGLVYLDVETIIDGEKAEFNYRRARYDYTDPNIKEDQARFSASIHVLYYNGDLPAQGKCIANYLRGHWQFR